MTLPISRRKRFCLIVPGLGAFRAIRLHGITRYTGPIRIIVGQLVHTSVSGTRLGYVRFDLILVLFPLRGVQGKVLRVFHFGKYPDKRLHVTELPVTKVYRLVKIT
jgi:hypothetical protein